MLHVNKITKSTDNMNTELFSRTKRYPLTLKGKVVWGKQKELITTHYKICGNTGNSELQLFQLKIII